jgi:hypothetical protein
MLNSPLAVGMYQWGDGSPMHRHWVGLNCLVSKDGYPHAHRSAKLTYDAEHAARLGYGAPSR